MVEPKSACPMLNALFLEERLRPADDGTVSLAELGAAMLSAGVDPSQERILRLVAALGSGGGEALVESKLGARDDFRVDLGFHLLDGVLGHAADSGVLGDPPGPRRDRFEALIAYAETRNDPSGAAVRVMTARSYLLALDARADGERAHQGGAFRGRFFAALEAQLIPSIFGELTVDQLRAFYFEGKIPPAAPQQPGIGALLPAILRRLPGGFVEDLRRALEAKEA